MCEGEQGRFYDRVGDAHAPPPDLLVAPGGVARNLLQEGQKRGQRGQGAEPR